MRLFCSIAILLFSFSFLSCHKDAANGNGLGLMSANINGTSWSSTWYATAGNAAINSSGLSLNASLSSSYMSIQIINYTGPGVYNLGGINGALFNDGSGNEYRATTGSISVSADNGYSVLGTFNFSGLGSNGYSFNVSYGQFNLQK